MAKIIQLETPATTGLDAKDVFYKREHKAGLRNVFYHTTFKRMRSD